MCGCQRQRRNSFIRGYRTLASVMENPYLKVLRGRIRNLRKNIDKLDRLEQLVKEGVALNPQQLESLRNKPTRQAVLWELEDILVRMETVAPKKVLSSVKQEEKQDPPEAETCCANEQQVLHDSTNLDSTGGCNILLETSVQAVDGMEEQLERVQPILMVLHVSDFITNEPEAVEAILKEGLDLGEFGKLNRVHLDSVNYFAKMLTSPDGDVPLEKALVVSTYHAMEYLQRSKREAIPGISYDFLYEIIAAIASHPLLRYRGVNNDSKTLDDVSTERENENIASIAEQINFFAQPIEEETELGMDGISNLQIGDSSITLFTDSGLDDSTSNAQFDLASGRSKIMLDDDNILIIHDENGDNPLGHFIISDARDISLEESISRSVFADTNPLTKSNSNSHQNGNFYKRNVDRVINEFISSEESASGIAYSGLEKSSHEDIVPIQHFYRNNVNQVNVLDWADEETHHSAKVTYDLEFEPNSGMPKRIPSTMTNNQFGYHSQSLKSHLETSDDPLEEQRTRKMEQGAEKLRGSKNRNKYHQYAVKQSNTDGNQTNNRQPSWTRRGRRNDYGKQSIRGRS